MGASRNYLIVFALWSVDAKIACEPNISPPAVLKCNCANTILKQSSPAETQHSLECYGFTRATSVDTLGKKVKGWSDDWGTGLTVNQPCEPFGP